MKQPEKCKINNNLICLYPIEECDNCPNNIEGEKMTIYEQVKIIYWNLRKMKEQNQQIFCEKEYKWVIGYRIAAELITKYIFTAEKIAEKNFLLGIEVEIDHLNPDNIRIYEDITNKIIN